MRKDKARDIARGVLPSTARKGARDDKRAFHAMHRHAQSQANHAIKRHLSVVDDETGTLYTDPDLFDDFIDPFEYDGYTAATKKPNLGWDDMKGIVRDRRSADKLGPLISWARATEKNKMTGWDVGDKIAYFKAVLPDSLQGRHALGHVKDALNLHEDEFYFGWRYNRLPPFTPDDFRAVLARILSTTKGRRALHDFILDTVPVAAHAAETNNKRLTREHARYAEGNLRYHPSIVITTYPLRYSTPTPVMVDVLVPQIVAVTCDDCAFLRNDPLATTEAINRFVSIVWNRPKSGVLDYYRGRRKPGPHSYTKEIIDYVDAQR